MTFNLAPADGKQVFIQMKGPTYLVQKGPNGQAVPSGVRNQQGSIEPIIADFLFGVVRSEGEGDEKCYVLHLKTPQGDSMNLLDTGIRVLINPDEIKTVCWESPIEVAAAMPSTLGQPPEQ